MHAKESAALLAGNLGDCIPNIPEGTRLATLHYIAWISSVFPVEWGLCLPSDPDLKGESCFEAHMSCMPYFSAFLLIDLSLEFCSWAQRSSIFKKVATDRMQLPL